MSNVQTFTSPGDNLVNIYDEFYVPSQPTSIYVSSDDFNKGVFYEHSTGKVFLNKYRDYNLPASSVFNNEVAMAQQAFTEQAITVNNVTNISNIVQNIINPPAGTTVDTDSIAAQFATLTTNYSTLAMNYQTLVTEVSKNADNDMQTLNGVNNNTQAIVALQNQVNLLVNVIKGLTILNISNQSYKIGLP